MRLQRYVLSVTGTRILGAAAVLLGILQVLDLLEVTTDILDRGLGMGGVFYYAALRTPRLIEQVAPISVLAGGLFAFSQLARESAIIAMRAAGISAYRIVAMAAPAAVAMMLLDFTCAQLIAPRTDPILDAWWKAHTPAADRKETGPVSFRVGDDLVVAANSTADGRTLNAVKIYRRDKSGRMVERVEAPSAIYAAKGWSLSRAVTTRFAGERVDTITTTQMSWASALRPVDVQALFSDNPAPSADSAKRALLNGGTDRPPSYYETRLLGAYAGPFGALIMLLLSAPVALANFRSRQGAVLLTVGLAAGLVFLVVDGLLSALGESGAVSPILAVWGAPVIFGALAINALVNLEG
ncbi:LptF/LptG family permease [Caulobacter sp. DWR1-3-2b1]|uniref:LptF/LptG family permease n=1 Tax=Caulobacter sp. DWR1-3-2b1 TaxID=2804670 RepID=UPI003CF54E1B